MIAQIVGKRDDFYTIYTSADFDVGSKIDVSVHQDIRTLKENAYFHKLVEILAEKNGMSLNRTKNELISSYGKYEYVSDKIPTYKVKSEYDDAMWERSDIHWQPIDYEVINDVSWTKYVLMRHTRTLNTKEMATLIDGALHECQNVLSENEYINMISKYKRIENE